jgi:hypothetical protein
MKNYEATEHICPVCKKVFIPAPLHIFKHATTRELVCDYACRCKSERESNVKKYNKMNR